MNENRTKKRGWVKNAAIIFLALLLALTFFSNTILNWSLPEVSGQYAGYGTITTSIRGTGTVQANMAYSTTLEETREIQSVKVRQGDTVEAGQVLFLLEEADSAELEAAKETLYNLEYQYQLSQLKSGGADYSQAEKEIADLQEDLADARVLAEKLKGYEMDVDAAKLAVSDAQDIVDDLTEDKAALDALLAELAAGEDGDDEAVAAALELRDAAKLADEEKKAAYDDLQTLQTELEAAQTRVTTAEKTLSQLLKAQAEAQEDYNYKHPMLSAYQKAKLRYDNAETKLSQWFQNADVTDPEYIAAVKERDEALTALSALTPVTDDDVKNLAESLVTYKDEVYYATLELDEARTMLEIANVDGWELPELKVKTANAKLAYRETTAALTAAQRVLDKAIAARKEALKPAVTENKDALKAAGEVLSAATEAQTKATEYETAKKNVSALEDSIASKKLSLESQKKNDKLNDQTSALDLNKQLRAIEKQKAEVAKLEGKQGGSEVLAKYAGIITSVNCLAGDKVTAGSSLCEINVDGKGYTLTISVTNEQSRMVNVGDKASVNNYWWGNVDVTLSAIKTDRSAPGQKKLLEFTVTGDVSDGQSLDITLGQRQTSYNLVVPNSAMREDSTGAFILIAQAKSTPLGNRYIATRMDVTVLEKDSYNTALDAGTSFGYDYVITASTKPIEAGAQVRLAEGK